MGRSHGTLSLWALWCLLLQVVVCACVKRDLPDLLEATLDELRDGLDAGRFSSVDLTKAYIARINEVSSQLHAVNEINPDALAIAAELDKSRKDSSRGPLHGIPVLIKDNIATDDKMNNTAGSFALVGARVPEDSTVAKKLRAAGAIILGKANLSQWANWRSSNSSSGWTSVGGQTIGAYYPEQDPSGSSSGSGVSSSIGLAWACLGTETAGSIISPSQENSIVGIKPSVGLTSRYLVVPISEHQDTVGPMARTVRDAAYLLSAIVGKDNNDEYTSAIPFGDKFPDYVGACKESGLKGKRIGVPSQLISGTSAVVAQRFKEVLDILRQSGATVVENVAIPGMDRNELFTANDIVLSTDFNTDLPKLYLSKLTVNPHNITSVAELQDFTQKDPREEYPDRNTITWQHGLDLGYGNDDPRFKRAYQQQVRFGGDQGLEGALKKQSLDALFAPSDLLATLASFLGDPVISVPIGRYPDDTPYERTQYGRLNANGPNRPFAFGFAGARFSEEALIGMAYALEQKTQGRKVVHPQIFPKTTIEDVAGK